MSDPELEPVEERSAVLLVGGLDPSAGAGLAVDEAVVRIRRLHPLPVATGIAVQNTRRFVHRRDLEVAVVMEQIRTVASEFRLGAVKVGMVGSPAVAEAVAEWLAERPRLPLVLDPVLRSTSGGALAETGMEQVLARTLLPRARVITPNADEASALTGLPVTRKEDASAAARVLRERGAEWVVVKGGHLPRARGADYLCGPEEETWVEGDLALERNVRGTGCALAAAIASGLALGEAVPEALRRAKRLVTRAMDASYVAGEGRFLELARRRRG